MSEFIYPYAINPSLTAFSTLRKGGVSSGNYSSFNINPFTGDNPSCVTTNKQLLAQALRIAPEQIILPHQTHQSRCLLLGTEFLSLSVLTQEMLLQETDSLITALPNVCIGVSTADCVPIILYDNEHPAIGVVHAGWRGTVKKIVQNTLQQMHYAFGTQPQHTQAIIAPSISFHAFEVGEDVFRAFQEAGFATHKNIVAKAEELISNPYQFELVNHSHTENTPKWHINLPQCNALQLQEWGIPQQNITFSNICTYTSHHHFFSARRLGLQSGRIFTGAMLATPTQHNNP